ncbi:MAG: hypothetical protein HDT28_05280 [Clostridiales bacterium]|nr:hypothetical protein [Clostridiales bacterium]
MRITRKQIAVIAFLNVVIILLVLFIVFGKPGALGATDDTPQDDPSVGGDDSQTVIAPPVPEHNKLRKASAGLVDEIVTETRLMGSGDETIVYAQTIGGVLYVFGNTTVADFDFDSYGGFVCRFNSALDILGFTYLDGKITAVCMIGDGFAVGTYSATDTGDSKSRLYAVDLDGGAKTVVTPSGEVADITVDEGVIAVLTKQSSNGFTLTEYSTDGDKWNAEYSTRISSSYTLDYFDCYKIGRVYVLAARAYSLPRYDSLVFYTFEAGGDPSAHFYGGTGDSLMQPYAVLPYPSGYIALCRREGTAVIVTVDYAFKTYRRETLGFAFERARLFYNDGLYYACLDCADGPITYEIDANLNLRPLGVADGMAVLNVADGTAVKLIGTAGDKLRIAATSGANTVDLAMNAEKCRAVKTQDGGLVLVVSSSGGDAVSAPTGGRDIYVLLMRNS